jgi:sensor histidine kinase YesM
MNIKWIEVLVHFIFWVSTGWLITSGFSIQSHEIELINGAETVNIVRNNGFAYQLLSCIIVSFIAFYINFWFIVKSNQTNKTKIWSIILVLATVFITIYFLTEIQIFRGALQIPKQIAFGVAIFYFSLSIAYSLIKKSILDTEYLQQLVIDKKQAELNLLRNQLQPHFLFNALNNLLSMVNSSKNPKLVNSFDKLSQLLRFVIEDNNADKNPIAKEIEFLKNYIDLQMLRFEEGEVNVQFNVFGEYNTQKVEPGLFIPFVENAFKYGTEPEKSASIEIDFNLSESQSIEFKIKNKALLQNLKGVQTGIEATRKRLDLIYPDKHKLTISNNDDFIVILTIHTK